MDLFERMKKLIGTPNVPPTPKAKEILFKLGNYNFKDNVTFSKFFENDKSVLTLAIGSDKNYKPHAIFWDVNTGRELFTKEIFFSIKSKVFPDKLRIADFFEKGVIVLDRNLSVITQLRFDDFLAGKIIKTLQCKVASDNLTIYVAGESQTDKGQKGFVSIFRTDDKIEKQRFYFKDKVIDIDISPDHRYLALIEEVAEPQQVNGTASFLQIYDLDSFKQKQVYSYKNKISKVYFYDEQRVLLGYPWGLFDWEANHEKFLTLKGGIELNFTGDRSKVFLGTSDGYVNLFNVGNDHDMMLIKGHENLSKRDEYSLVYTDITRDGRLGVSCSPDDGGIYIWGLPY